MNMLKHVPLIKGLLESSWQDHVKAIEEVIVTSLFSFLPILIGTAFIMLQAVPNDEVGFLVAFKQSVSHGELILYSSSILSPILYLVFHEPSGEKHFKERCFQGVVVSLLMVACYVLYSCKFLDKVVNFELLVNWSYWLLFASVIIWYLATVFKNMMVSTPDLKEQEKDATTSYFSHREKQV